MEDESILGMLKHRSERFDVDSMDWQERNMIYTPELQMTWSGAWSALKKSWKLLKQALKEGNYERAEELKMRITKIRTEMGLEGDPEVW